MSACEACFWLDVFVRKCSVDSAKCKYLELETMHSTRMRLASVEWEWDWYHKNETCISRMGLRLRSFVVQESSVEWGWDWDHTKNETCINRMGWDWDQRIVIAYTCIYMYM